MWNPRLNLGGIALTLAVGCALIASPGEVFAQRSDARSSAEFTARTSVQTIYENLKKAGYEWPYIRDEKMPEILIRSVDAVREQTSKYDRSLILGTWIPTYIRTFYDEIDKINAQHEVKCMDVTFIEVTFVPFVTACVQAFDGKYTVQEIAGPILETEFTFTVCDGDSCPPRIVKQYNSAFPRDPRKSSDFMNVCSAR
jgi:hypothetical protein